MGAEANDQVHKRVLVAFNNSSLARNKKDIARLLSLYSVAATSSLSEAAVRLPWLRESVSVSCLSKMKF